MISSTDTGSKTLQSLAKAHRLNRWIYDMLKPWMNPPILELGSGTGNLSRPLLEGQTGVSLSDAHPLYAEYLRRLFKDHLSLTGVYDLDLVSPDFDIKHKHLLGQFSSVIAINVIEHIADDRLAISNALKLLKTGGCFVMLVPAMPFLYNEMDRQLDHYRRYNTSQIVQCFTGQRGVVIENFYFNVMGAIGWFFSGSVFRLKEIQPWQISVFEYLVPACRWLERRITFKFGLSMVAVFRKEF